MVDNWVPVKSVIPQTLIRGSCKGKKERDKIKKSQSKRAGIIIGVVIVTSIIGIYAYQNFLASPFAIEMMDKALEGVDKASNLMENELQKISEPTKPPERNLEIDLDEGFTVEEKEQSKPQGKDLQSTPVETRKPENKIEQPVQPSASEPVKSIIDNVQLEKRIHDLINEERVKNGLKPLSMNPPLSDIARKHSQDMADRGYFAHESPEGKTLSDRYNEGKFNCRIITSQTSTGIKYALGGENIYWHSSSAPDWNFEELAQSTVSGWMTSEGHRENILTDYFKSEGIGVAVSNDKLNYYMTEDFC